MRTFKSFTNSLSGKLSGTLTAVAGVALAGTLALALTACGGAKDTKTIVVGASPSPHAEILEQVKGELEKQGYKLEIKEFNDYIQPNEALASGELDANYFQHQPYLDNYNKENKTDIVSAGAIHFEPLGLYAGKSKDLANIPDGAQIAVPSDATNEARALLLLQDQGVLKLKDGAGLEATANDIAENPHNIKLIETEAASLARTLQDVDFAVINGNYALSAGLDTSSALATEAVDSEAAKTYANIVAVRKDDKDSDKTKALVAALQSDTVRDYINKTYKGSVVAVF